MAKKSSKKEELTLEEKLEKALVPEEEQPYEVPENWVWVRLGSVIFIARGGSPRPIKNFITESEDGINWIKIGDTKKGIKYITNAKEKIIKEGMSKSRYVQKGDFLLSNSMSFGRPYILNIDGCIHDGWLVLSNFSKTFTKDYLFYLLSSAVVYEQFTKIVAGAVVDNLNSEKVSVTKVPIPPLAEQTRIVSRIESLFSKLDEARELIESSLNRFEERKSAILHKAFTGELTKKWREENGVGFEWEEMTLGEMCHSIYDGDHNPPPQSEKGIPFLVISDVRTGVLTFTKARFVPEDYYNKIPQTKKPEVDDILYTVVGSYGIPVIINQSESFCFQRHIALLKPKDIISKLLWYLLQTSDAYNKATEIATGTAQLTVPIKKLRLLKFHLPTLPEQEEIVRILDDVLGKEGEAKELLNLLEKIDLMKKAILGRAFRGELGTNRGEEESAEVLLREVLESGK